jgi:hypothetical protein
VLAEIAFYAFWSPIWKSMLTSYGFVMNGVFENNVIVIFLEAAPLTLLPSLALSLLILFSSNSSKLYEIDYMHPLEKGKENAFVCDMCSGEVKLFKKRK